MKAVIILSSILALMLLTGCATHDPRDSRWDPKPGQQLFDQLPAWDRAAEKVCCGHLKQCLPHQSPRC